MARWDVQRFEGTTRREGERDGAARAIPAYREALQERTRDRVPLEWAKSTGNQGVTVMLLAERRCDGEMAKLAVQQLEAAFTASKPSTAVWRNIARRKPGLRKAITPRPPVPK